MKKAIITFASFFFLLTAFAGTPSDKVLQLFNATFNSPQNVTWFDAEDYYGVSFLQNGISTRVRYDKEGNFKSAIRYYEKQHLPINMLSEVTNEFSGMEIFGVTEVTTTTQVSYHITLQDEHNIITVNVNGNGQISKLRKFKKS